MDPILTLTVNPTVDVLVEVDELEPTGKVRANLRTAVAGGGGINVARGICELGGDAVAIHTSGGAVGEQLDRLLDGEGIEHVSMSIEGETREAILLVERAKERSFHIVPSGPEVDRDFADRLVATVADLIGGDRILVASGSLPPGCPDDLYARLAAEVRELGARLVLDTSGAPLRAALEEGVHFLKPNRREAADILGRELEGFEDARQLNDQLLGRGVVRVVATTLGDRGAVVSTEGRHVLVRTPPLPRPFRSDAGAGDSFVAAMTTGLAHDGELADAGRLAVAAAAAACMTPGTEMFEWRDVEALRRETVTEEMT